MWRNRRFSSFRSREITAKEFLEFMQSRELDRRDEELRREKSFFLQVEKTFWRKFSSRALRVF